MKTTADTIATKMRGGVRRRGQGGSWSFTVDLGPWPAQRCNACNSRHWRDHRALKVCPTCGGELRDTRERRQQTAGGYETRTAAAKARTNVLHAMGQGTHVAKDTITLGDWLTDEWLPSLALEVSMGNLRRSTVSGYTSHVTHHLAPTALGGMRLQELSPERIKAHYSWLLAEGRADGSKDAEGKLQPLTASTVRRVHATLHRSLRDAVRSHLIPINPAGDIELKSGGQERAHWTSAQLRTFLTSVSTDRLAALWLLYATTGARRGELLGLTWDAVDFDTGKVKIHHTLLEVDGELVVGEPKTKSGRRTIALDPATVASLKRHRTAQKTERLAAGSKWVDSGYVFVDGDGQRLWPGVVSRTFTSLVKRTGLPLVTLHGLRHTFAYIALVERRQPVSKVSARLGHKDESVTLTIYTHVLPEDDEDTACDVAGVMVPAGF